MEIPARDLGGRACTVTFYLRPALHRAAAALHARPALARVLPPHVCSGAAADADGAALPPCVVLERGTPLPQWLRDTSPFASDALRVRPGAVCFVRTQHGDARRQVMDRVRAQALAQIAARVAEVHRARFVHGGITASVVMWLPRAQRWALQPSPAVHRAGDAMPSLKSAHGHLHVSASAAPECLSSAAVAAPPVDTWGLGLVGVYLLTGERAWVGWPDDHREVRSRRRAQLK